LIGHHHWARLEGGSCYQLLLSQEYQGHIGTLPIETFVVAVNIVVEPRKKSKPDTLNVEVTGSSLWEWVLETMFIF